MSPLNAAVILAAQGHNKAPGVAFIHSTAGAIFTFVVVVVAIVGLGYAWMHRPFKKKGR